MRQAYWAYLETIDLPSPMQRPDDHAPSQNGFSHLSGVCRGSSAMQPGMQPGMQGMQPGMQGMQPGMWSRDA